MGKKRARYNVLLRQFGRNFATVMVRQQGKGFYLTRKSFLLNIFSKTEINEISS